jgi:Phosphopantetheine attachment site
MTGPERHAVDTAIVTALRQRTGAGIPPDASFFEAGLTSTVIVSVHAELQQLIGREFPVAAFFRYPTRRALAGYLSSEPSAGEPAPIPDDAGPRTEWTTQARRYLRVRIRQRGR